MATILVASLPFAGHVGAMAAVAGELTRRGHEVVVHTGAKYQRRFVAAGAAWLPWAEATDFDDSDLAATFPRVGDGKGFRSGKANVEDVLAINALAGHKALVVCTTGGTPPSILGPLPDNVRAASFVPHDRLLPMVDVMVTNGGWGGVLAAVQAAVPLVVAAGTLDKPEVARRVAWSEVGINLRTGQPSARAVRHAVEQVLDQPHRQQRARELAVALTAAGGVDTASTLLEELLT